MAEKALWTTVMNSVIKEHGESQRRKWKVANENEALCSICEETGGILIRCAHEKCSAHFHLDCALNQGGISLMDNGLLICECDVHYKEIIFCSCKQKYDSNKAMIFCDECCDWYHLTCEHISSASQHLDRYTCRSCQDLLNHGKSVSKTLKEKNLEKEFRSTCNQNALRIIGHINELAVVVCPVIDSISQSLRDDEEPIDISELNNTIEYLSTPPYSPETKEGAENSETLEDDCNFLRLYGVHDLVRHWLDKCRDGKASWGKWLKNVEKLTNSLRDEFPMNFNHENITIAQQKFEEFKTIELQKPISISGFDGLVVLGDILKWILEFLQALHNVSQADFWTQHLSTLIRSVQGKVKKALSLTKEESFFVEFAKWFQFYAKSASEIVNRVGNWSNSVHRILRQEVECSLADAQKLLQSADGRFRILNFSNSALIFSGSEFPVRLTLIDTLKTSILQGTDLDGRIEIALQQSEIDDSEIEKLNDEVSLYASPLLLLFLLLPTIEI